MNIRPLHDQVIVKCIEEEKTTASGIVIPDAATEKPNHGIVLAVGNGAIDDSGKLTKPNVNVGDHILFGQFSGKHIKVDDEQFLVLKDEEVMCVIEV